MLPYRPPEAVHPGTDGHQARLGRLPIDIGLIKPASVDIAGSHDMEDTLVRGARGGQHQQRRRKKAIAYAFHHIQN